MSDKLSLAVVGNPNSGKTTLFNEITGLSQKVGNFPGVTVEMVKGEVHYSDGFKINLIDLPGAYSLHSNTKDEFVLTQFLIEHDHPEYPEGILYVADLRYLDKQLLLLSQIYDCGFPLIIALSNGDKVSDEYKRSAVQMLETEFHCPVIPVSNKDRMSILTLKEKLRTISTQEISEKNRNIFFEVPAKWFPKPSENTKPQSDNIYKNLLWCHYGRRFSTSFDSNWVFNKKQSLDYQIEETLIRYQKLDKWTSKLNASSKNNNKALIWTEKIDRIATHPVLGLFIYFFVLLIIFQAIFSWAIIPMDFIEGCLTNLSIFLHNTFPPSPLLNLCADGILSGLSGVLVFVPQIAILFLLIGILEEIGYMARVVYIFDHVLKWFGLNGRSIIGLVSGGACAVPAIMTTRTIANRKQRFITMFIIPFIPCSARIPVYTALIGFIIPYQVKWWIFNTQGLVFMGLYFLGIGMALLTALMLKFIIKSEEKDFLLIQLPDYQFPYFKQILFGTWVKVKSFFFDAGKVIVLISVILWFLANFSWPGELDKVRKEFEKNQIMGGTDEKISNLPSTLLEHSFAGKIGKLIEPLIEPLGFDWKIGIAIITSFAAREVFVGTMATIYNLDQGENQLRLRDKMATELRADGTPLYDMKTALSLTLFYAFAMQCISTMVVMKRETQKWRWPIAQFVFMTVFAYLVSFFVYNWF